MSRPGDEQRAALVEGRVINWPDDLYIPPDALEIFLESFQGPLDLLLYLIRRQNLDILDIPVADITRQYMAYVELMHRLRLDLAAEYLVMAAMLAEIKSRMLLPRPVTEDEEGEDPRAALVRRLQAYERFRQAADDLYRRPWLGRNFFIARATVDSAGVTIPDPDVSIDELMQAFRNVIELAAHHRHWIVGREVLSTRERMSEILTRLQNTRFLRFDELFRLDEGRMGLVVTFVALLELVRDHSLILVQNEAFAPIHIRAA